MIKTKGQVLLVIIIVIIVFLIIVSTFAALMAKELKLQRKANDSLIALYAAESGAEQGILNAKGTEDPGGNFETTSDPIYKVQISHDGPYAIIRSTGEKNEVKRTVEVKVRHKPACISFYEDGSCSNWDPEPTCATASNSYCPEAWKEVANP